MKRSPLRVATADTSVAEANPPWATVVVTTCGTSPSRLVQTVRGALAQDYERFDVVVVDNRPRGSGVEALLASRFGPHQAITYAAEPRPGLSCARNRGARTARGEIVAFTDDDVDIDRSWLSALVSSFADPWVACVTGLIVPLEVRTHAQRLFEEFGGYGKGLERRTWDSRAPRADALFPYGFGAYGSGANAAFRRKDLIELGGFDVNLGAGTATRGGEDLDMFARCLQSGRGLVYEPRALVRHRHHEDLGDLYRQIRGYGVGLGALMTKQLFSDPRTALALLRRLPSGLSYLLSPRSAKNASRSARYPRSLVVTELAGVAYGPIAYARSCVGFRRRTVRADPNTSAPGEAPSTAVTARTSTKPPRRRLDRLTTTAAALMANIAINSALGMVFWGLASNRYSLARLGENAALISAMMLLSIVAQLNLSMGIARLLPKVRRRRWRPILAGYSLTAAVAVAVTACFVVLAPRLSEGFGFLEGNLTLAVVLVVSVVLWNVFALQDAALTAARWAAVVPIENGLFGVLKIVLMVVVAGRFAGHGVFVAWVAAMAVMLVPVNGLLFAKVLPSHARPTDHEAASLLPLHDKRRIARYLATDYAAALLSHGYMALLPLLVIGVLGRTANAHFYIAFLVVVAVIGLTQSLSTSLVVEGAHHESELARLARRTVRRYVMFVIPAVAVLVVGATWILRPFGPGYAHHGETMLRLLLVGTVPQSLVLLYLGVERVRARVIRVLAVEAATVALVTFGVVVGMRGWGLNGLGVAWLLAHSVVAIVVVPRLMRASRAPS